MARDISTGIHDKLDEDPEDTSNLVQCEICGKVRPMGEPCCAASMKNVDFHTTDHDHKHGR